MAGPGAPLGNQNGAKAKRWQKALERALARASNKDVDSGLDEIADQVVNRARAGDKDAWKEVADRMDGKVPQGLEHSGPDGGQIEQSLAVTFIDPASAVPDQA